MADDGWFPDPFGRYQRRWFDGERWTERVMVDDQEGSDPLGATPSVPFATPTGHAPPTEPIEATGPADPNEPGEPTAEIEPDPTAVLPSPVVDRAPPPRPPTDEPGANAQGTRPSFVERLGPAARERQPTTSIGALGAAGGVAVAIGVLLFLGDDPHRAGFIVFGAALVVGAWFLVSASPATALDLRAAAVGVVTVGIVAFAFGAMGDEPGAERWFLIGALFLLGYLTPGFRGRTFMLGAALIAGIIAMSIALADQSLAGPGGPAPLLGFDVPGRLATHGRIAVICGAACCLATILSDRRALRGIGAAFAAAAIAAAIGGSVLLWSDSERIANAVAVALSGIATVATGHLTRRRATTWVGAGITTIGLAMIPVAAFEPDAAAANAPWLILGGAVAALAPRGWRQLRVRRVSAGSDAPT